MSERLQDLADDYVAGTIDDAGLAELEALLLADADARRRFAAYCRHHTALCLEVKARRTAARALDRIGVAVPKPAYPLRRPRLAAALLAACVLLGVGGAWLFSGGRKPAAAAPAEVAWLVNAQNCQWAEGPVEGGLRAGSTVRLERGLADFLFASGARVVVEGPANLELLAGDRVRLVRGRLAAKVPPEAVGFTVLSPQGKVIDLGTEFGVAVGEDGAADVRVFEGKVIAEAGPGRLDLTEGQAARVGGGAVTPDAGRGPGFVREIVPPPVISARSRLLTFRDAVPDTLADAGGLGTGLTMRLPGTGRDLASPDANLRLNRDLGRLELTTTNSDINNQIGMPEGEYLGVRLSEAGFTGAEDFEVSVSVENIPALKKVGQFGLFAGTRSDKVIRGGLISLNDAGGPGQYRLFHVNNNGGRDTDSHFLGLLSTGDDLRMTLRRREGRFALVVENRTTNTSSTLTIRHPDYLDGEKDLVVGLFGANTRSEVRRTLWFTDFRATVWTVSKR